MTTFNYGRTFLKANLTWLWVCFIKCVRIKVNGWFLSPWYVCQWICITLWCSLRVYAWLWHSSMVMSHCNIHEGLCYIARNIPPSLCHIITLIKGYVASPYSTRVILDWDIHQCLCHIVTFIFANLCWMTIFVDGHIAFWHSSRVMLYFHIKK